MNMTYNKQSIANKEFNLLKSHTPSVEMVASIELYEPTTIVANIDCKIDSIETEVEKPKYGKLKADDFYIKSFYHFTFLVEPDGSLWVDGNRYLLSKLQSIAPAKPRTIESIASDLINFRKWLIVENIDYLIMPLSPRAKPTYRYCKFLHEQVEQNRLNISTAKRRMISVQNFYRWLIADGYNFEYDPWLEMESKILHKDKQGLNHSKSVKSTDLTKSFKHRKNTDEYAETINDGGKLRPLTKEEQVALFTALKEIGNTEMLLGFLLSITTGCRLQTTFTLRACHFKKVITDNKPQVIKIGRGTLIDSKYDKNMTLEIPAWVYKRIQIYLSSNRYKERDKRANLIENAEQYVFLTKDGNPYYMSKNDKRSNSVIEPPRGNAITQFIRQQLKPQLIKNNQNFEFRFHDLRATFGMNLVESLFDGKELIQLDSNQPKYFEVLNYVRQRMGHSRLSTTEEYLNYRKKYKLAKSVQQRYEQYLLELIQTEDKI